LVSLKTPLGLQGLERSTTANGMYRWVWYFTETVV